MKTKNKTKQPKIYTQFLLPDGDKITLSWRDGSCVKDFISTNPDAVVTYKSVDHPNAIEEASRNALFMKPVLTCKHNISF